MNIERLPILYRAPFDCINANETCPGCKRGKGDHGVSGSIATFAVRCEHAGKRYAVTLEVLGGDFLPVTQQWWRDRGIAATISSEHRPGALASHREDSDGAVDCPILGEGHRCTPDVGYLAAEALFKAHGNPDATVDVREQPEALWTALEHHLINVVFGPTGGAS